MKKLLLSIVLTSMICLYIPAFSNEIEEDYFDMAASYSAEGDYTSAMQYIDNILRLNPSNQQAQDLKRGLTHVMTKDNKTFVTSLNPLVKQAEEYRKIGDVDMELSSLMQGTQSNNAYLAYYYLGNFYRRSHQYSKALDAFNSAVSARPDFAQSYLVQAIVLNDIGEYTSAINPIDKYLTFNPKDDLAYAIKSRAEFSLGRLDESKADNDKAIELNNCPEYQFDRAKILYKYGNYEESKKIFSSLLQDIQTSKIYEYMGLCDYALGDYTSAISNIDKAILLSDDDEYLENKYNEIKKILEQN